MRGGVRSAQYFASQPHPLEDDKKKKIKTKVGVRLNNDKAPSSLNAFTAGNPFVGKLLGISIGRVPRLRPHLSSHLTTNKDFDKKERYIALTR